MKSVKDVKDILILTLLAVICGAAVGAIDALFGRVLLSITDFRDAHPVYLLPFLALAGLFIIFYYTKWGKGTLKGMGLVFDVAHEKEKDIPLRLIPFITVGTWLTHLFGGSAGREGVAVQMGATLSYNVGKRLKIENAGRIMLVAGMAAGFSGLFETPIAATFFAMEVIDAGRLKLKALLPSLSSAIVACFVSHSLGLPKFSFAPGVTLEWDAELIFKLAAAGVCFGIVGGGFAFVLAKAKKYFGDLIKNPYLKIGIMGAALSVVLLLLFKGRYSGLGTNLISMSLEGENIYCFDFALKFILTIFTLAAGFQGGEVTPLFSIGASLGVVLGSILGLPTALVAGLGYASVFGAATNTLIAPIFIGVEVFGYEYLPTFALVMAISYCFNGNQCIYGGQKDFTIEEF